MRSGGKGHKKEVVQERILHDINSFFRTSFSDQRLKFVCITKVEIANDYSVAKVYWDTYDPSIRGDIKQALAGTSKKVRSMLCKSLNIRHTPEINFIYDSQFEDEKHISELLDKEKQKGKGSSNESNEEE